MDNDSSPTSELAVSAHGLVKTFGDLRAVDGVDLEVRRGEVFGVLGPNGAGKTTMLQMLATLLPLDGGDAQIFGVDVRDRKSTRLNSSHMSISYAVFCLKKKKK